MNNFYSATTKGFYHPDIHGDNMPPDAVPISDELYESLISGQHQKEIVPDESGAPMLVDAQPRELSWVEKRQKAYPPIPDQLDLIFHEGLDAWKAQIQEIKDRIPKI